MIEIISTSLDQTVALGRRLGQLAVPADVIALDGELGAGKTQFVRGLALGMNLDPGHVSSPTFVFMHEYIDEENGRVTPLVHIDAYRLTGPDDLATLGFDDELRDSSVTAVEWAELITTMPHQPLGDDRLHIQIEHHGPDARRLTLTPHGRWTDRLPQLQTLTSPTP